MLYEDTKLIIKQKIDIQIHAKITMEIQFCFDK